MTWLETHERTRIIREVEAVAVVDLTGRLPWKAGWASHFGDREGLLDALRERWERMCLAQVAHDRGGRGLRDGEQRLRRTHAGMLRILEAHPPGRAAEAATRARGPAAWAAAGSPALRAV